MSYLKNFKFELAGPERARKLVFLHGVMGSGANWRKIIPQFTKDFRVLTYDQRGHGWSFKPESGYAPADYAQDLKLILDELGWDKVSLVGHSMGGRNALQFAHLFPQRLERLVVEDIGPQGNPDSMKKTIKMVEMVPVPFASKAEAKEFLLGPFVQALGGKKSALTLGQYFYTNIQAGPDGKADWRFSKDAILSSLMAGHFHPLWEEVKKLSVPTLFVRGGRSSEFPRSEFEKVLTANPQYVTGIEVADAGHWVHFDRPLEFSRVLRDFLEK